jgi:hypothetical protein
MSKPMRPVVTVPSTADSSSATYTGTNPNGWRCMWCSSWIPLGVSHGCSSAQLPVTPSSIQLSDADVERIAQRVVELLRGKV